MSKRGWWVGLLLVALVTWSGAADAFCGFYVAGADAKLFNNATLVVLMRDGQRTVLSMQNNYQGPPENFAMVVPVPVVLQKENVKTLDAAIFDRVDRLAAPRLVEYWEKDPCAPDPPQRLRRSAMAPGAVEDSASPKGGGVKIEAQFKVGEYEIVILSADDSSALDRWLRDGGYKIPEGAEPLLRPYVQEGMKFFVAKVDVKKVTMKDGMAMLSPLRFHYDDVKFRLPVKLGLVNSQGTQDLIVHIIAAQRYDLANFPNATIPTNIDLDDQAKSRFGEFYAALFDKTLEKNRGAVVTEYAWATSSCDPCPSPPMNEEDFMSLGGDVSPGISLVLTTLTRLHARYGKDTLGDDLVFKQAEPIAGGREWRNDGVLEKGAQPASYNNFQGRYAIRHTWTGAINCNNPIRGRWEGPPGGGQPPSQPAVDLAFAPRGKVQLASFVRQDVPELALTAAAPPAPAPQPAPPTGTSPPAAPPASGCGSCVLDRRAPSADWLWLVLALALLRRSRS